MSENFFADENGDDFWGGFFGEFWFAAIALPVNVVAPQLTINPNGTWEGNVGEWENDLGIYVWELRYASDGEAVATGSGDSFGGIGLISRDYILWVESIGEAGNTEAESEVVRFRIPVDGIFEKSPTLSDAFDVVESDSFEYMLSDLHTPVIEVM
jgi:hypothetical protein